VPDPRGFLLHEREDPPKRPVADRVRDYGEVEQRLPPKRLEVQAARCMDCGIPFCHTYGCPLGNLIPDWNDMVGRGQWRRALELLELTNTLPEITGRVCPAPCEPACTLAINQPAVTIKHIELQIIERGWEHGWVEPSAPKTKSGKRVAVVGSGPSGLAAARRLAGRGHEVVVFERSDRVGGILRYGIPDFKLDKGVIDRRTELMGAEGIAFETGVAVGEDLSVRYMRRSFDALLIAAGARVPRDLDVPGRELDGVHLAMTYLTQQNRVNGGEDVPPDERIRAAGRNVVVIGGGDTGADCVGTARRQGARTITQIELLPEPPPERPEDNPWPEWPKTLRTSSSHEEGCERRWSILTKEFVGVDGRVTKLRAVKLDWSTEPGQRPSFTEIDGSAFELEADLVLLALGFLRIEHGALTDGFGLKTDARGNIEVGRDLMTSTPGVFAGGDAVLGASLVVRAIDLGQRAAEAMNAYLEHSSLS
jgi:NAD(P)H-dependent glutamate synthase small subunit